MTAVAILAEISKMTTAERLTIVESVLQSIREDLTQGEQQPAQTEKKQLTEAAEALLSHYIKDKELTIFTSLDSEEFHA